MFAFGANSYAVGFAQSQANGDWSNASTWNWRNMTVDIPAEGYPNTSDTSIITHVALVNNVNLDVNAIAPLMFVSGTLNVVNGSTLNLTGYNGNFLNVQNGASFNVVEGSVVVNKNHNDQADNHYTFGGYDASNSFHAATAGALTFNADTGWIGLRYSSSSANSSIKYYFDNSSLSESQLTNQGVIKISNGRLGYLSKAIDLDFSNVDAYSIGEGTYYVSLISYENGYYTGNIHVEDLVVNSTLADGVSFLGLEMTDNSLYAKIAVAAVPEPATYAAIFGALALAFAAYRRRK